MIAPYEKRHIIEDFLRYCSIKDVYLFGSIFETQLTNAEIIELVSGFVVNTETGEFK